LKLEEVSVEMKQDKNEKEESDWDLSARDN
jgi:hypothetical protein